MGCIRLLFAIVVVARHFSHYPGARIFSVPDDVAVQGFYICSGFLITLVLTEKYNSLWLFYTNRLMRIYPIYWAALVLYILANWLVVHGVYVPFEYPYMNYRDASALWWTSGHEPGLWEGLAVAALNIGIIGQDVVQFIGGDYHYFVYVRVAWTLALELTFYAIAPTVVTRVPVAVALTILSFAVRFSMFPNGYPDHLGLFAYKFFPFELGYFLLGSLAYRLYRKMPPNQYAMLLSCGAILILTAFYRYLPLNPYGYLAAVALCLPGAVAAGKSNPFDAFAGDLSYPLYLLHPIFTIIILKSELFAIAGTSILVLLFVYLIDRPIDRWRQLRARNGEFAVANACPRRSRTPL